MKSPLNKARIPENKANEPRTAAGPVLMDPGLQKVMDLAAGIQQTDPEKLEGIQKGLAQARAAQEAAAQAKEEAETEAEFDKACDDAIRAREKEEFFLRLLEKYRYTPRMDEAEYFEAVDTVKAVVNEAVEAFRDTAGKAMAELINARENLLAIQKDADHALRTLNRAANVLQVKYRYQERETIAGETVLIEDPNEWTKHTPKYDQGEAVRKALTDPDAKNPVSDPYDKVICAAWSAAERVSK